MDIDHEARKRKAPRSTVAGEAKRAEAEDPSDQIRQNLDDASAEVASKDSGDSPEPRSGNARPHGAKRGREQVRPSSD
jgi:hypothetical protein